MKNWPLFLVTCFICSVTLISCKRTSKTDTADKTSEEITLITDNEDQYPRDIDLLNKTVVSERLKDLLGEEYEGMLEHFETQTPIVSVGKIYKFTGCEAHNCPNFLTTVYYDAKHDNFNVVISKRGKVKVYAEGETISIPKALDAK